MNRYCVDCRHSIDNNNDAEDAHYLVYGQGKIGCYKSGGYSDPIFQRQHRRGSCGPEGKFWEAKE